MRHSLELALAGRPKKLEAPLIHHVRKSVAVRPAGWSRGAVLGVMMCPIGSVLGDRGEGGLKDFEKADELEELVLRVFVDGVERRERLNL